MDGKHDLYLVVCPTCKRALFWMGQFAKVFYKDIIILDKYRKMIQFEEATYYFISESEMDFDKGNPKATILTEHDIAVILNDEEFKRKSLLHEIIQRRKT